MGCQKVYLFVISDLISENMSSLNLYFREKYIAFCTQTIWIQHLPPNKAIGHTHYFSSNFIRLHIAILVFLIGFVVWTLHLIFI
jgi:hypothetical protein